MGRKGVVLFIPKVVVFVRITWRLNMSKESCCGIVGALFGHSFVARYSEKDVKSPGDINIQKVSGSLYDIQKVLNPRDVTKSYECDVCVRCGKIVVKNE
jgi:hypothetical protein